jgi:hypothetical protein
MPLFGKGKKDKADKKGRTPVKDRFMTKALNAKFPQAKSNDMLEHDFTQVFSEKKLKNIGVVTDRLVKGRGKFDKLYQQAKQLSRNYTRYIDNAPVDAEGNANPDQAHIDELITGFTQLETLAQAWLKSDEAKWDGKDEGRKDSTTQIKEIEARGMLQSARMAIFQLQNFQKLRSPAVQKIVGKLEEARDKAANGDPKDVENYRSMDAAVLGTLCGDGKPDSGTSDVKLIKGPDGGVAYAFKSVEGESDMMGTPKGYATAREVLMSNLIEKLNDQTQLNLGWPKASMAKVGDKSGALIDGVQGKRVDQADNGIPRDQLPPETLQKILLSNLCAGQFDIKWEDVRLVEEGDTVQPICMDGGASLIDPSLSVEMLYGQSDGKPGGPILDDGVGGVLPAAQQDISTEMVDKIMAIDTKALKKEMAAAAKRLEKDHGLSTKQLGIDGGLDTSMSSIEAIQKIIKDANGKVSLEALLSKYHQDFIEEKLVKPNKAKWEQDQLAAYQKLLKSHPGVFLPLDQVQDDIPGCYRNFLHPECKADLKNLVALAGKQSVPDFLNALGVEMPFDTARGAFLAAKRALDEIQGGLKAYAKLEAKHPGLLPSSSAYASPQEAYAAILARPREMNQLVSLAAEVAKLEGLALLSVADLLKRSKIAVPIKTLRGLVAEVKAKDPALQAAQKQ